MMGLRGIPATDGGVEHAVDRLSRELVARGHDVTVYARTAYARERVATHGGVRLRYLPQIHTKRMEAPSHTLLAVLDAMRGRRHDVLHIHATGPALFSVLPRLARIPTVVTVHGEDWRREKWGPVARAVLRAGLRVAVTVPDRTIVVSETLCERLRETFDADPVWIPNGIDSAPRDEGMPVAGLEPGRFLLFLGRLVPEKGIHTLLRAFGRTDLDQRLVIVGAGTHTGRYVRELEQLAAADPRVTLYGPAYGAEKAWLLSNAQLVVQPSTLEGMPIVLLEAAASARPCLVSDIPEHMEIVRENGSVQAATFRAGDEDSLAAALRETAARPDDPRGRALQRLVLARYQWAAIAERTETVYRGAIAARLASPRQAKA
jgi:glycosyltransferase involved in cell wall biosynthesis